MKMVAQLEQSRRIEAIGTMAGMDHLTQRAAEMIQQLLTSGRKREAQLQDLSLNHEFN